ncbi:hypothetical protein Poli38472_005095 [Pythium oligandrum]|uniref:Uncharacterized protein n=1 Tax=Pythium oligandrum TaxID=41045 RepID=A0A8K1FK58_PYTOL|nr:hypothetical protein Poli38472_005095 [Pythium oligandrum]|eukprot:TMW62477.1 hypothetical protein Poli38472_005095 [Pythium oligandrum]
MTMASSSSALEALLRHIIEYGLPERDEANAYLKNERDRLVDALRKKSAVAKFWFKAFGDVIAERLASDVVLQVKQATQQIVLAMRRSVILGRS